MSTLELQNQLIRKILEIKDQEVLEYLFTIAANEHGAPYKLKSFEQQFIRESLDEYEAGKVISNDEVFAKTDQWLSD
jgi:hypothetical protein